MDQYLQIYDSLEKIIIYDFNIGDGGIGDLIKFFMFLLNYCINNNIKIHYLVNDILIEKYLILKYKKFYIKNITNTININNLDDLGKISPMINYLIKPFIFYNIFNIDTINLPINYIFEFSEDVIHNVQNILKTNMN